MAVRDMLRGFAVILTDIAMTIRHTFSELARGSRPARCGEAVCPALTAFAYET